MSLLSFHNDKKIKAKYVTRLKAHAKADNIIQGLGWENGKGCAVGCTLENYSHAAYETELGLPEWLARLEDTLFEGLPNKYAKKFAVEFLLSIPVGKDLTKIKWQFCNYVLKENLKRVQSLAISKELMNKVSSAIRGIMDVNTNAIKTGNWDGSAARSAWSAESAELAARSAAWSARSARSAESAELAARSAESAELAARSARSARSAESAELAARSARSAAELAAWSAELAARSAARSARSARSAESAELAAWSAESAAEWSAYKRYAKHLLKLLKGA